MSESKSVLTLITRDGKLQVSHALAKQISPLLKNFIDNWNQDDTIYLNYTSEEVSNVLNIFNPPGTLKDFLLIETKTILFVDVLDDIKKYTNNMKVKVLPNLNIRSANIDGKIVSIQNPLEFLITLNNKNCLYLVAQQNSAKYLLYRYNKTYTCIAELADVSFIDKINSKQPEDIKYVFESVFYYLPKTLLDFYPMNEGKG
jgi:hypothetical protein